MPRKNANKGAMGRVWEAVRAIEPDVVFTSRVLLAANPELAHWARYPEKSVGKCMSHIIARGGVVVVSKRVISGETHATCFYRRVADELTIRARPKPVKQDDGLRHVRLMDTRHPYREPKTDRPWRGYTSSLAFLG